jgi:HEAT repeat protein
LAFEALEILEKHGGAAALAPLRETWNRRFGVGHIAARTAASAVVLGDTEALSRLRDLARSWRRATRTVALAELVRVGNDEDFGHVFARVRSGRPEAAHVVAEAWRRADYRALDLVAAALRHRDPEVRAAACESAARIHDDGALLPLLTHCLDDPSPVVANAAREALSQREKAMDAATRTREHPLRSQT